MCAAATIVAIMIALVPIEAVLATLLADSVTFLAHAINASFCTFVLTLVAPPEVALALQTIAIVLQATWNARVLAIRWALLLASIAPHILLALC